MLRNTRSGCGIMAVKRPSAVVTAVRPPGLPLGLNGYCLGRAPVLSTAHGGDGLVGIAPVFEVGKTFAVRHGDRQAAAAMPAKNRLGSTSTSDRRASKRSLWLVVKRGQSCTGDDVGQFGKHLAAVAHAQAEGVGAGKEGLELLGQHRVEQMERAQPMPAPSVSP